MTVKRAKTGVSIKVQREDWTESDGLKLQEIRTKSLGWSQKRLADKLGIEQPLISAWEAGTRRPSSWLLIRLSSFPTLSLEEIRWLLGKAGMEPETIEFLAAGFQKQSSEPPKPGEVVTIKPMRTLEGSGHDLQITKQRIPNPIATKYVTVRGNFMQPIYKAGDILVIDESLCVRCDNCEKACAETHHGVSRLNREAGPTFEMLHVPTSCRHCENPKCMTDCSKEN